MQFVPSLKANVSFFNHQRGGTFIFLTFFPFSPKTNTATPISNCQYSKCRTSWGLRRFVRSLKQLQGLTNSQFFTTRAQLRRASEKSNFQPFSSLQNINKQTKKCLPTVSTLVEVRQLNLPFGRVLNQKLHTPPRKKSSHLQSCKINYNQALLADPRDETTIR